MENVLGFLVGNWVLIILCIAALAYLIYKILQCDQSRAKFFFTS